MMRLSRSAAALALAAAIFGCGHSPDAKVTASIPHKQVAAPDGQSIARAARDDLPDDVVRRLLEALRAGDETTAANLLTAKARQETAKHNLVVQPPGSAQATYQVGRVEFFDDQKTGAYVSSIWNEPNGQGTQSFEVVWVLRCEKGPIWRVAGMATEAIAGGPPVLFNFEDPEDMLRKWQQAHADLAARDEGSPPTR
jgi:hypothetical protein